MYSALQRTQRFYITDTVDIRQCNYVAAANQRQLRHSNTQNRTYGLGNGWLSHSSFAQFSNETLEGNSNIVVNTLTQIKITQITRLDTCCIYKSSLAVIELQLFKKNIQILHFQPNLTADDPLLLYMTFHLISIQRNPYCTFDIILALIGLQLFKLETTHIMKTNI